MNIKVKWEMEKPMEKGLLIVEIIWYMKDNLKMIKDMEKEY